MKRYEEQLKLSRKTGKGIVKRFQEKASYKYAINGFDCPHCNAKFGGGKVLDIDIYETPRDIEFMCNNTGYSWTEDCKCGKCDAMYSQSNGC